MILSEVKALPYFNFSVLKKQIKKLSLLSNKERKNWINSSSSVDLLKGNLMNKKSKSLIISNIKSFEGVEAIITHLQDLIENDVIDIKWKIQTIPNQGILFDIMFFDHSQCETFLSLSKTQSLIKNQVDDFKQNIYEGTLDDLKSDYYTQSEQTKESPLCVSHSFTQSEQRFLILLSIYIFYSKQDPFKVNK